VVAAFLIGGAITTVMAFALGLVAHDAVITRLGPILGLGILRLVSALLLGAAMALPFLIAKARGPLAPGAAAIGALAAERVGTLAVGLVRGTSTHDIQAGFGISVSETALYSALDWVAILLVPVVAGGLTAIFALRTPKPSLAGPAPAGPYGPGQPAPPQYRQPATPFTNPPANPAVPPAAPNPGAPPQSPTGT